MKITNLTPHALHLNGVDGVLNIPPSGQVTRLAVTSQALDPVLVEGITLAVTRPTLGEITGLPEPTEGVIFVASALVAEAAQRRDVFSPGELIRDEAGRVIGARGLCTYMEGTI
jgi:hypothetical protein